MTNIILSKLNERLKEREQGDANDKIVNPLSTYKTVSEKRAAFNMARHNHEFAIDHTGNKIPLSSVNFNDVDFIGGLWRIQRPVPQNILMVRGRPFILGERIERQEKNLFEFYHAALLFHNCYGYSDYLEFDTIVAKYTTDNGTYWSYGQNIEQARAFLGIRLYDEYMDLVHSVACKDTLNQNQK